MTLAEASVPSNDPDDFASKDADGEHGTLKYSLLGPSLTKAGQDAVDQKKVRQLILHGYEDDTEE
jgi:DNA polymerase kappa